VYGNELFVAAAGDSRAVAGIIDEYSEERVVAEPLSIDHRLNRDSEIGRVTLAGGRVEPSRSFNGAFRGSDRLWLRHLQVPGLMVSRSIGDEVARQVQIISQNFMLIFD
jgi:serine/threonine protein phosphatase PrpC